MVIPAGVLIVIALYAAAAWLDVRRRMVPRIVLMLLFLMGIVPGMALGPPYFLQPARLAGLLAPLILFLPDFFALRGSENGAPAEGAPQQRQIRLPGRPHGYHYIQLSATGLLFGFPTLCFHLFLCVLMYLPFYRRCRDMDFPFALPMLAALLLRYAASLTGDFF